MIYSLFTSPLDVILSLLALVIAITIHEFSHAWMADYLRDPTPRLQKRLTLNPLAHLDVFGTLFILFARFGWGKPVVFDPFNLKNPRRDAALISIAGPASNLALAIFLALIVRLPVMTPALTLILSAIIMINVNLAIFNLLPFSPLDGFKIVGGLLSKDNAKKWFSYERYGFLFLLVLIVPIGQTSVLNLVIQPIISFILKVLLPSSVL